MAEPKLAPGGLIPVECPSSLEHIGHILSSPAIALLVVLLKLLKTKRLGRECHAFLPFPSTWAGCPELGPAKGQQGTEG